MQILSSRGSMACLGLVAFGHLSVLGTWTKRIGTKSIGPKQVGYKTYWRQNVSATNRICRQNISAETMSWQTKSIRRHHPKVYPAQTECISADKNAIIISRSMSAEIVSSMGGRTLTVLQGLSHEA